MPTLQVGPVTIKLIFNSDIAFLKTADSAQSFFRGVLDIFVFGGVGGGRHPCIEKELIFETDFHSQA